jgi:hypothetical protein
MTCCTRNSPPAVMRYARNVVRAGRRGYNAQASQCSATPRTHRLCSTPTRQLGEAESLRLSSGRARNICAAHLQTAQVRLSSSCAGAAAPLSSLVARRAGKVEAATRSRTRRVTCTDMSRANEIRALRRAGQMSGNGTGSGCPPPSSSWLQMREIQPLYKRGTVPTHLARLLQRGKVALHERHKSE